MPRSGMDDDRQLVLDFDSVRAELLGEILHHNGNVISFSAHVRPAKTVLEPSPAVERLLLEAKHLKW